MNITTIKKHGITTLQVLSIHPPNTSYAPAYITVLSSTGRTFDIMAPDISRFCL
jgi:hypothetical protein